MLLKQHLIEVLDVKYYGRFWSLRNKMSSLLRCVGSQLLAVRLC